MSGRPSTSSVSHTQNAPTVPPVIHNLAAPPPQFIDSHLPSYLVPCMLDLLRDSTRHVIQKKRKEEDELRDEGLLPPTTENVKGKGKASAEDEARAVEQELGKKVESIGLMVGGYVAEKLALARPPLASQLDIIKFICKDLFLYVYSKQIDNLRTNHRGIYVLQSHAFPPLMSISSPNGPAYDMEAAKPHLIYPQALIQGALGRLGMPALVVAESAGLPQCTFQIREVRSNQPPPSASVSVTPAPGGPQSGPTPTSSAGHQSAQSQSQSHSQSLNAAMTGLGIGSGP